MTKARVTSTDALANVIEVVELGQRTGLLSVERGSGSVREMGEIYFVSGRPVYASLAGLRGREALAALSRWGGCRFAFDREAPRPAPNLSTQGQQGYNGYGGAPQSPANFPAPAAPGSTPHSYSNSPSNTYGSNAGWPAYSGGYDPSGGQPNPFGGFTPAPSTGYLQNPGNAGAPRPRGGGVPPNTPSQFGSAYNNGTHSSTPSQFGGYPDGSYGAPQHGQSPQGGGPLGRRPRRAPDVRDLMTVVTNHNLSRSHRTLLLLADGEHTVLDLARLSSKPVDEVMSLLAELESRSLIYYYG